MENLKLADPEYDKPGRIDVLLGVEVFLEVICQGRLYGLYNSPTTISTEFGWVLAGNIGHPTEASTVTTHVASVLTGDDILQRFWNLEEKTVAHSMLTLEERAVLILTVIILVTHKANSSCHYLNIL